MSQRIVNLESSSPTRLSLAVACSFIIPLRLLLPSFLRKSFFYVQEDLSNWIIVCSIFLIGIIFCIEHREKGFLKSGFEGPLTLWLLASGLSLTHSVYFCGSWSSLLTLLAFMIYFYILIDLFNHSLSRKIFIFSLITGTVIAGVLGVYEYFIPSSSHLHGTDKLVADILPYKRVASVFSSPNVLAGFYLMFFPFLMGMYWISNRQWQRVVIASTMGLSGIVFLMTLSFLCTLNLFIAGLIFIFFLSLKGNFSIKKRLGIFTLIFVAVIGLIVWKRNDFSVSSRMEYLQAAWKLLKNHPWLGNGIDTFRYLSPQYTYHPAYSGYVHNSYLQIWCETGILGFIAILWLLAIFIRKFFISLNAEKNENRRIMIVAWAGGLVAFFIDNLTNVTLLSPEAALFGWIILAAFQAESSSSTKERSRISPVVLGVVLAGVLIQGLIKIDAARYCQKAMEALDQRNYVSSYSFAEKAQELDPTNQNFPAIKGLNHLRIYELSGDTSFLQKAKDNFQESARLSPYYYPNYVMLGKIARLQGNDLEVKQCLRQIARLYPGGYVYLKQEVLSSGLKPKKLTGQG